MVPINDPSSADNRRCWFLAAIRIFRGNALGVSSMSRGVSRICWRRKGKRITEDSYCCMTASKCSFNCTRARCSRLRTVPTGTFNISAIVS